jgi:hypothetical protein
MVRFLAATDWQLRQSDDCTVVSLKQRPRTNARPVELRDAKPVGAAAEGRAWRRGRRLLRKAVPLAVDSHRECGWQSFTK